MWVQVLLLFSFQLLAAARCNLMVVFYLTCMFSLSVAIQWVTAKKQISCINYIFIFKAEVQIKELQEIQIVNKPAQISGAQSLQAYTEEIGLLGSDHFCTSPEEDTFE